MAISKQNIKKLEWLFADENKCDFIQNFIKIADKNGNIVPFVLTHEQRELIEGLDHLNIISKSRQLGVSVCCAALAIRECIVKEHSTNVLISHSQASTNAVFDKLKQMFYSLPEWIRPDLLANNRQALTFANGSSIVCQTAGNKELLRGNTVTGILHASEFAFWKGQDKALLSMMQAVSSSSTVIVESTSNGFNRFSKIYMEAKNGESAFKPFFFNFINGRTLFESQYKQAVKLYKAQNNGKMLTEDDYDDEEKRLAKLGMTPDQAIWRRQKISTSSPEAFRVEFPATPEESFLATGTSVFDSTRVSKLQQALVSKNIKPLTKNQIVGIPAILQTYLGKSLYIWKIPQPGMKYYIGVDVSEGLGGKHDYSTMFVMDKDGHQVAEFRNNSIKPYLFADIVDAMGRWYNKALLTVEKASGGHSVIERLRYEKHYMNMTKYKTYDEFKRVIWNVGFDTNNKTKSIAVNDAREWFDKGLVDINSNNLLEEMKTFVADDKGGFNAVSGSHDDLISALWLCIQGYKQNLWYPF